MIDFILDILGVIVTAGLAVGLVIWAICVIDYLIWRD